MNNGRILSKSFTTFAKVLNSTQTICDCFAHTHTCTQSRTHTHPQWDHTLHNRIGADTFVQDACVGSCQKGIEKCEKQKSLLICDFGHATNWGASNALARHCVARTLRQHPLRTCTSSLGQPSPDQPSPAQSSPRPPRRPTNPLKHCKLAKLGHAARLVALCNAHTRVQTCADESTQ